MADRILLADDAPAVRQAVRELLEREGFEVVGEAANGLEAVQLAKALRPDVAILDLSMPEMSGLDAAREIQQVCPWTHLILLTVHAQEHHIVTALRAGIQGYVVKAKAADDLARAIGWVSRGGTFLSPTACRVVIDAYLSNNNGPLRLAPPVTCDLYDLCPAAESEAIGPTAPDRAMNAREPAIELDFEMTGRPGPAPNPGLFPGEPSDVSSLIPGVTDLPDPLREAPTAPRSSERPNDWR